MHDFTEVSIPDIMKTVDGMYSGIAISFTLGNLTAKRSAGTSVQQAFAQARTESVRITCNESIGSKNSSFSNVTVTGEKDNVLRFLANLQKLGF